MRRFLLGISTFVLAALCLAGCSSTSISYLKDSLPYFSDNPREIYGLTTDAGEEVFCEELDDTFSYGGVSFLYGSDWVGPEEGSPWQVVRPTAGSNFVGVKTYTEGETKDPETFKKAMDENNKISSSHTYSFSNVTTEGELSLFQVYEEWEDDDYWDAGRIWMLVGYDPETQHGFEVLIQLKKEMWNEGNYEIANKIFESIKYDPSETTVDYFTAYWTGSSSSSSSSSTSTPAVKKSFAEDTLAQLGSFETKTESGTGDSVVDLPVAGTPCLISISHDGGSNFAIWSVNSSGENVDLLVNTIGSYSGTVTNYGKHTESAMLSIKADGNWTITIAPLSSMQPLENGATYTGDDVRYIDTTTLTKITIENTGDSNFTVRGIGISSAKLLVNEIGSYSGTVIWNENQSFLIVGSNGNWSVSW